MSIRLVNTTTRLRIDEGMEKSFAHIISPAFRGAVEHRSRYAHVDVLMVATIDRDLKRLPIVGLDKRNKKTINPYTMDLLGIYIPHHPLTHGSMIKVCPERVMDACLLLKVQVANMQGFRSLYPTLLYAVIIHELAHLLMDDESYVHRLADYSGAEHASLLDNGQTESQIQNRRDSFDDSCGLRERTVVPHIPHASKTVEESLASAFTLQQDFTKRALRDLRSAIACQPPAYKAGLRWEEDINHLLDAATLWREYKKTRYVKITRLKDRSMATRFSLKVIEKRLLNPHDRITTSDLQDALNGAVNG